MRKNIYNFFSFLLTFAHGGWFTTCTSFDCLVVWILTSRGFKVIEVDTRQTKRPKIGGSYSINKGIMVLKLNYENLIYHATKHSVVALLGESDMWREVVLDKQEESGVLAYGLFESAFFGRFKFYPFHKVSDDPPTKVSKFYTFNRYDITFRPATIAEIDLLTIGLLNRQITIHKKFEITDVLRQLEK
jgi:hypothetical protein